MTTKDQIEKLIPLDLDIDQLGGGFEFGANRDALAKSRAAVIT